MQDSLTEAQCAFPGCRRRVQTEAEGAEIPQTAWWCGGRALSPTRVLGWRVPRSQAL